MIGSNSRNMQKKQTLDKPIAPRKCKAERVDRENNLNIKDFI